MARVGRRSGTSRHRRCHEPPRRDLDRPQEGGDRVCVSGSRHRQDPGIRRRIAPSLFGSAGWRGRETIRGTDSQHLDRYYDEVISQLGQPEAVLIFGPGEAKLQLKERLSRSKVLAERIVGIETTDKLTDPQIVAKVKEHYGIDR